MYRFILALLLAVSIFSAAGCGNAAARQKEVDQAEFEKFTLGQVQRSISKGVSQADVAKALGSPNIVSRDSSNSEVWIYDRLASAVTYSKDAGGVWLLLGGYQKQTGAINTSQKTLTVIIKFDSGSKVEDVSYHASQF